MSIKGDAGIWRCRCSGKGIGIGGRGRLDICGGRGRNGNPDGSGMVKDIFFEVGGEQV